MNHLAKSGNFYYLNQMPSCKFTMKNAHEVFAENPGMFGSYYDQFRDECAKMLDDPEIAAKKNRKMMEEVRKDIHDMGGSKTDIDDMDDIFATMIND